MEVRSQVELIEQSVGGGAALDLALAAAQLQMVAAGSRTSLLRCYAPEPTVAFSRRDRFLPGFRGAVEVARRLGFEPVLRAAGGRVVAYHEGCLVLDEIVAESDPIFTIRERFAARAEAHARALRGLGIDARVGELPGEYCPGEFSVNARGRCKLVGSAQRIVRGAWLLATVVVVTGAAAIRPVLDELHAALGISWDPDTAGSVADEEPGAAVADVRRALLAEYEPSYRLVPGSLGECELAAAREHLGRHLVDPA